MNRSNFGLRLILQPLYFGIRLDCNRASLQLCPVRCCQTMPASGKLRPRKRGRIVSKEFRVFVTASTECFPDLPLHDALQRLVDLEFTSVEIAISESGPGLKPSEVLADPEKAIAVCRDTHRLTPVAYGVDIAPGE